MESYTYLLLLAVILLSTKVFGLLTEHVHLPQVVGALLAGIIMGPSGFGVLESTDFLVKAAEIGVIMLMFTAGIDTDMNELKETGVQASVIAVLGVFTPLLLCGGLYFVFFCGGEFTAYNLLKSAFMGSVFSATSVSITVETLNEMGKLKTKTGTTLLSAALIDDIIGIVVLSVLSAFSSGDSDPVQVLFRIVLFFVFVLAVGLIVRRIFIYVAEEHWHSRRVAVWSLAFCLLMAYCSEEWFGVADITGAYFAGLILCNVTKARKFVAKKFTITSYMVFTPVFFAGVGMKTNLRDMNSSILAFALLLGDVTTARAFATEGARIWGAFLYVVVCSSMLCYVFWGKATTLLGSVTTSLYMYLMPVFTVIGSAIIVHDPVTPFTFLGIAAILLGVGLSQRGSVPLESAQETAGTVPEAPEK